METKVIESDDDERAKFQEIEIRPPSWAIQTLIDRKSWPFLQLAGVTETPFVRQDGGVVDQPGFDAISGYHLAMPQQLAVHVHDEANLDDASAAYDRILDLFSDFPFELPEHAAGAVAAVLTLVARPAINGPCPLFVVTSSTPGSGKSLLVDVIHAIGVGRKLERTAFPGREEELEKRITSILMASYAAACFDNIDSTFGGPTLDALITASSWMGRELGKSRMLTLVARTIWFATGNNIRLGGDMGRRIVPIRIEPRVERPEDRSDFKYPNILQHVHQNRAAILNDCLTILAAFCRAGSPPPPRGFGSFEDWNRFIRGAVLWSGGADPAVAARAWADEADEKRGLFEALAAEWYAVVGPRAILLSEIPLLVESSGRAPFRDAVKAIAEQKGVINTHLLGNRLKREKGRIFGGYMFDSPAEKVHGSRVWQVVRTA